MRKTYCIDDAEILPYVLYADESCVSLTGMTFYPVVAYLVLPPHLQQRERNLVRLAEMPILKREDTGLSEKE